MPRSTRSGGGRATARAAEASETARIAGLIIAAMPEEVAPVVAELGRATGAKAEPFEAPAPAAWTIAPDAEFGLPGALLVIQTGIGLAGTAATIGWVLAQYAPRFIISAGTTGGLAADINVGDVVAGSSYTYGAADATAFGYVRGQIPQRPATFPGDERLLAAVPEAARVGQMISSDSFVTEKNVGDTREAFPEALSTDMESCAAAQAAWQFGVPFMSVRSVSDLCGPQAGQDFHMDADRAAAISARAVAQTVTALAAAGFEAADRAPEAASEASDSTHASTPGSAQKFDRDALRASLLFVFGTVKKLEGEPDAVPEDLVAAITEQIPDASEAERAAILARIAGAIEEIARDPHATLTAKQYDSARANLVQARGVSSGRGTLVWPPTSQTVMKRSGGYWNDALTSIGLSVQVGRRRGGLKYDEADYENAVRAYVRATDKDGDHPSFNGYQRWGKEPDRRGTLPSGAAIRQYFGSWSAALDAIR